MPKRNDRVGLGRSLPITIGKYLLIRTMWIQPLRIQEVIIYVPVNLVVWAIICCDFSIFILESDIFKLVL